MWLLDFFFRPPNRDQFARLYLKAMRRAGVAGPLEYDRANFRIVRGSDGYTNLENLYREYLATPRAERSLRMRTWIASFAASQLELPEDFEDVKPDLRPKIWSRMAIECLILQSQLEGSKSLDLALEPLGEHLYLGLVYDLPHSMRSISQEDLDRWSTGYYEAREIAFENLLETTGSIAGINEQLYQPITGDNYDACRLLLVEQWRGLAWQGDPIAMVANRDSVFIAGSEDLDGLRMLLDLTEKALEEPRPLLATPLRLEGETWVDWFPDGEHPLYDRFRFLQMKELYSRYQEQKTILEAWFNSRQEPTFVASFTVQESKQGRLSSLCVWSDGVETLLPRTDTIVLFREGQNVIAEASWKDVESIVGYLFEPTEYYPERVKVSGFPTPDELAQLRELSSPPAV